MLPFKWYATYNRHERVTDVNGNFGLKQPTAVRALMTELAAPCSRYPSIGRLHKLEEKSVVHLK